MRRLTVAVLLFATALLTWAATSSGAPTSIPAGPRLAVVLLTSTGKPEMVTIGPGGEEARTIVGPDSLEGFSRPVWSPDGGQVAFLGRGGFEASGIYLVGADGSGLRRLAMSESPGPGTVLRSEPVFDPTSGSLVVDAMKDPGPPDSALWSLPLDGSRPHRLSPWTALRYVQPYSVTPSGKLVAEAEGIKGFYVGVIDQDGGGARTLVPAIERIAGRARWQQQGADPAVSPDGTQVAYLLGHTGGGGPESKTLTTDLMVMPIAGGTPKRIARIKGEAVWPSWDPSGARIAFTVTAERHRALKEINADGSCLSTILKAKAGGAIYGAAWQPGEGRGAGPISC